MRLGDTIAAAIGGEASPRGMVRVSGPAAIAVLERIAGTRGVTTGVAAGRIRFTAGELPALAIVYRAPRSFSGEDTLELLLPGNREVLRRVLAMVCATPEVRQALPGEFTARAFLNGRLSAEQAEGVGALIASRTHAEQLAAERLLSGAAGAEYREIADELASALALVEAGIGFTDQDDVVAISSAELRRRVRGVLERIESSLGGARPREATTDLPLVALVGAPNAGKSTLFNALLRRERTIVSDVAGTTRDVIVETADLAALGWVPGASFGATLIRLADLAGLDDAMHTSPIERDAQRAAREGVERADVLVWCDPTGMFEQGAAPPVSVEGRTLVRVRTKADLGTARSGESLSVCALDGWHLPTLVRAIQDAVGRAQGSSESALVPRHARAMETARASLVETLTILGDDDGNPGSPEVIATCLRTALDSVGSIAGHISPDDVIGRIFATFCIGK